MFDRIKQLLRDKRPVPSTSRITTDIHSHLLPGIDDGVESFEEALDVVEGFMSLGYTKLITTPHIMQDYYRNEPEEIRELVALLQSKIYDRGWDLTIEAEAESYLDEGGLVNFVGSECYSMKHLEVLRDVISDPYFLKAAAYPLLNSSC